MYTQKTASLINKSFSANQRGEHKKAEDFLLRALRDVPNSAEAWYNLGISYSRRNLAAKSFEAFKKAASFSNSNPIALSDIAVEVHAIGFTQEAILFLNQALALDSNADLPKLNLARILIDSNDAKHGLLLIEKMSQEGKQHPEAKLQKAIALVKTKEHEEGTALLSSLYKENPTSDGIYLAYLDAISQNQDSETVLSLIEDFISKAKNISSETLANTAAVLLSRNEINRSIDLSQKALEKSDGNSITALNNLAQAQKALGNDKQGLILAKRSFSIATNRLQLKAQKFRRTAEIYHSFLLGLKMWNEGWRIHEHRSSGPANQPKNFKALPYWKPEDSEPHNNVLILAEQGIGDEILFFRFLHTLDKRNIRFDATCDPRLISIFSKTLPTHSFLDRNTPVPAGDYTHFIFAGSLPQYFAKTDEEIINTTQAGAYLSRSTKEIEHNLKDRINIGISWKSKNPEIGAGKSIHLQSILEAVYHPNTAIHNLQYGDLSGDPGFVNAIKKKILTDDTSIDKANDIETLIIYMETMDLIVTTSNATAHFAGAIGKPTLLLAPRGIPRIWYWKNTIEGSRHSLWYPSIKILEQDQSGSWDDALNTIRETVKRMKDKK